MNLINILKNIFSSTNVEYITQNDGKVKKLTKTDPCSDFKFLGDRYSIKILRSAQNIKIYLDDYDFQMILVKDKYGRLFLYTYKEEMNFNGGADRVDEVWSHVADEKDAETQVDEGGTHWGRVPYVYTCESGHTTANEYLS